MHRRSRRVSVGLLSVLLTLVAPGAAASAADMLPDFDMANPADMRVERTSDGRKLLRYSAVMVNKGVGPFNLVASRSSTSSEFTAVQRISSDTGGYRDVPMPATRMVWAGTPTAYGGDGHNHWHVLDLEQGNLYRLDNGKHVGALAKHGFCIYDNVAFRLSLPGAPQSAFYPASSCGTANSLALNYGLSVGWGDRYASTLMWQWIDITGLTNGRYELRMRMAGPDFGLIEVNPMDNDSWARFTLRDSKLRNITYGGGA